MTCSPSPFFFFFLQAKDVVFKCLGWSIRHFMILRDNYFGSFTHFSTLNEYLEKRRSGIAVGDPIDLKYRPGKVATLFFSNFESAI